MDALLQIIVPKIKEIDGLELIQPIYEWDGEEYPQGPKLCRWEDVEMSFDEKAKYVERFLPPNYLEDDWIWLKTSDNTLDNFESEVNDETDGEKPFEKFLRYLLVDIDKWCVVFLLQYDQIDNVYQLNLENCITELKNNLNRNKVKKGFVAYK